MATLIAAGLAAAISLGEFGATSFLSRTGSETMPVAIEGLLGRTGDLLQAQAYALATILAAVTVALVLVLDPQVDPSFRGEWPGSARRALQRLRRPHQVRGKSARRS